MSNRNCASNSSARGTKGESLSAFVESSVRDSVRRRLDQADFVRRGIASLNDARRTGQYVGAEAVVRKLQERLVKAQAGKGRKSFTAR